MLIKKGLINKRLSKREPNSKAGSQAKNFAHGSHWHLLMDYLQQWCHDILIMESLETCFQFPTYAAQPASTPTSTLPTCCTSTSTSSSFTNFHLHHNLTTSSKFQPNKTKSESKKSEEVTNSQTVNSLQQQFQFSNVPARQSAAFSSSTTLSFTSFTLPSEKVKTS